MFIIYRTLFLAFKKIQMARITLCQIPTTQDFPLSYWGIFPLKKHWRWEYIHTSKTSEGKNIFLRKYIISKSVMENNTISKRKASSQCPPTLCAGGTWKICNVRQKEGERALFKFLKREWIFSRGGWGFSKSNFRINQISHNIKPPYVSNYESPLMKTPFMEQWPNGSGTGFPIHGSCVQNHQVTPRLTQPFILPRSIKWISWYEFLGT